MLDVVWEEISRSVAEHVVALMFAEAKNLYYAINEVKGS